MAAAHIDIDASIPAPRRGTRARHSATFRPVTGTMGKGGDRVKSALRERVDGDVVERKRALRARGMRIVVAVG